MSQGSLFTTTVGRSGVPTLRPIARSLEPASQEAAGRLVASGAHATQAHAVLAAIAASAKPPTTRELAARMGWEWIAAARRVSDLAVVGWVRSCGKWAGPRCAVTGIRAKRWEATDLGRRALALGLPMPTPAKARERSGT